MSKMIYPFYCENNQEGNPWHVCDICSEENESSKLIKVIKKDMFLNRVYDKLMWKKVNQADLKTSNIIRVFNWIMLFLIGFITISNLQLIGVL